MSSHAKGKPIAPGFCEGHLRFVVACADGEIELALAGLPAYDLARLRRLLAKPLQGVTGPEQKKTA